MRRRTMRFAAVEVFCVWETTRESPGLRRGAVEQLPCSTGDRLSRAGREPQ